MTMATLNQIEENINHLPLIEQLWLLEHLARQLRENLMGQSSLEAQLVAMALDPEIQNELREPAACCDGGSRNKGNEYFSRLSNECSDTRSRERLADGDGIPVFPDSFIGPRSFP